MSFRTSIFLVRTSQGHEKGVAQLLKYRVLITQKKRIEEFWEGEDPQVVMDMRKKEWADVDKYKTLETVKIIDIFKDEDFLANPEVYVNNEISIKAIMQFDQLRGYIFVEATNNRSLMRYVSGIPRAKGAAIGVLTLDDLTPFIEPPDILDKLKVGDTVEIIGGGFAEGKRAAVTSILDKTREVRLSIDDPTYQGIEVNVPADYLKIVGGEPYEKPKVKLIEDETLVGAAPTELDAPKDDVDIRGTISSFKRDFKDYAKPEVIPDAPVEKKPPKEKPAEKEHEPEKKKKTPEEKEPLGDLFAQFSGDEYITEVSGSKKDLESDFLVDDGETKKSKKEKKKKRGDDDGSPLSELHDFFGGGFS